MNSPHTSDTTDGRYTALTSRHLDTISDLTGLSKEHQFNIRVLSTVLPFRTNRYVIRHLIDWNRVPDDPVYQLVFPQPGMLDPKDFRTMADLVLNNAPQDTINQAASRIRATLNPHPAGQRQLNIPAENGEILQGIQHKYRETVLFFPSRGQTCHAYCTFCFRWAQFVGDTQLKISSNDAPRLHRYLASKPDVSDLLVTGGDPMIMSARNLRRYLEPLIQNPALEHIQNIRIGTKSLTFWPHRFLHDRDSDDILRLLSQLVEAGRHVAIMAHFNHGQEMRTHTVQDAISRIQDTGTVIRAQAPLLRHINDNPNIWASMWRKQVRLGIVPYYMFVERDTGARRYFEVPLVRCWEIFQSAIQQVSGLARTVRGPSMSATPGKVEILGTQQIKGEKVFILRFLQGRNPDWTARPFMARFNPQATWLDQLEPAFGDNRFFFEEPL